MINCFVISKQKVFIKTDKKFDVFKYNQNQMDYILFYKYLENLPIFPNIKFYYLEPYKIPNITYASFYGAIECCLILYCYHKSFYIEQVKIKDIERFYNTRIKDLLYILYNFKGHQLSKYYCDLLYKYIIDKKTIEKENNK